VGTPITPGTFNRDGNASYPATISAFKLDAYEVTVARFRQFVNAVLAGWQPPVGSGKHTHLNGGNGLANSGSGGGFESGWDASWPALPTSLSTWTSNLTGGATTWTSVAGVNDARPINNVDFYDAYAFCTWDGGFLPSEAEWNYAASGGSEQRKYPWGATDPAADTKLAIYGCYYNGTGACSGVQNIAPVGTVPAGNGKWGQSDLAGNIWEWNLDWFVNPYVSSQCTDCADLTATPNRAIRGSSFNWNVVAYLLTSHRDIDPVLYRHEDLGVRCARRP
jgi:formylglycine-generating enzyme required for sulfatase activity